MLYEESFKNHDFCQVIRNILYLDEDKRLISYFSHSELHSIGTTDLRAYLWIINQIWQMSVATLLCSDRLSVLES